MKNKQLIKSVFTNWPRHGWLGLGLIVVYWYVNWGISGLRSHLAFFPLWLGYCLVVDALVLRRKGTSMLTRNPVAYIQLFIISAPAWWLFELINLRTQNWLYLGREHFTDFQYAILATLSFSTVMPAVFGTAELVGTFGWLKRITAGRLKISPTPQVTLGVFALGWLMLSLLLIWPLYFFPFVWGAVFFILEPVNVWLKHRNLTEDTVRGEYRSIYALWVGCLICGFFWEMWNFYSYPKWIYQVPFVDFMHIFEMPILGYGGYIPFALELYALYHLVTGLLKQSGHADFLQIISQD